MVFELKKWGETRDHYTYFVLEPLPACFTTEQRTVEASLFVKYIDIYIRSRIYIYIYLISYNTVEFRMGPIGRIP